MGLNQSSILSPDEIHLLCQYHEYPKDLLPPGPSLVGNQSPHEVPPQSHLVGECAEVM